ncbi:MAG: C1 family peptidase [Bacteroidota bacterium]
MRISFLLAFSLFLIPTLFSQPDPRVRANTATQGIENTQDIDQLMMVVEGVGASSREDLQRQNVKAYMMPVRDATDDRLEWAYVLAGALEYYTNINQNYKDNLSPDLIALSLAAKGDASNMEAGLVFLRDVGTVSSAIVPYGSQTIPPAVYSVPRRKIANFGYLFRSTTRARNRVFETRKALSRGNPVIVELSTGSDFVNAHSGLYVAPSSTTESHHLVVVGFDENAREFEMLAAKGRGWGDKGYIRIGYDDFGRLANGGYVLFPG